jgi:hypothetical protein
VVIGRDFSLVAVLADGLRIVWDTPGTLHLSCPTKVINEIPGASNLNVAAEQLISIRTKTIVLGAHRGTIDPSLDNLIDCTDSLNLFIANASGHVTSFFMGSKDIHWVEDSSLTVGLGVPQ